MAEIKIVSVSKGIQLNMGESSKIFDDTQSELTTLVNDGWKIVGVIPERTFSAAGEVGRKGWIIELLRKIPVINIVINFLWPLGVVSDGNTFTGIILQKD